MLAVWPSRVHSRTSSHDGKPLLSPRLTLRIRNDCSIILSSASWSVKILICDGLPMEAYMRSAFGRGG